MRLVEDEEGGPFSGLSLVEYLHEEAVFGEARPFAEGRDDEAEQPRGFDVCEMEVKGEIAVWGEGLDETA